MRPRIDLFYLITACAASSSAVAQQRDFDLLYGRWLQGNQSTSYAIRTSAPLAGIFSHGFTAQALVHDSLGRHRAFYGAGWELQALRHRATLGPYVLAGAALGLSTDTSAQSFAALWSVGAGLQWRPVDALAFAVEGRYRLQDVGPRGFWRAQSRSHRGVGASIGLSLSLGRAGVRGIARPEPPKTISGNAAGVVRTALDALGTPYVWGGTAANGFDCSGLVQWAYGQHGIRLPRISREQATSGSEVTPVVDALRPGDILLFVAQPGSAGGVSHVGMYVGDQTFIHSANDGVKLSRLVVGDPDGAWWVARWVGARRVVQ